MKQSQAALAFTGVTKTYSKSHLGRTTSSRGVLDLSLEVSAGEAFGLLGLNGSGKTTTFKLALGLIKPTLGSVVLLGGQPGDAKTLGRVGYLPELPYFYSYLTPREALRFYGSLSGISDKTLASRVAQALEAVKLSPDGDRRMGEFSKGMIQRVGLAQSLLHEPDILFLDEPVSGLDPLAIKEFRDLLQSLSVRGTTIILSSHSISEVERLCQRVAILKEGRLARVLSSEDWKTGPGLEALFVETVR